MLSPAGRCCALTGLLMTSDFDPDGAVKLRAFSPSGSGIAAASHLHESQGKNSCFLRSQPPQGPRTAACGRARRPCRAEGGGHKPVSLSHFSGEAPGDSGASPGEQLRGSLSL